jgi:ubiquinone/menaquinone biosynthesis C-methylase UbiE
MPERQLEGREEREKFSFSRFARQGFYTEVNARLVKLLGLQPGMKVVDLACGTGAVTRLILERLQGAKQSLVLAVDASAEALEIAKRELSDTGSAMVKFVQGQAERLSQTIKQTAGAVDAVVFCNAIHMVEDKVRVLREVFQSLAPGGRFAFNTTFFAEAYPPETERFYIRWMTRALRLLKREYGLRPTREKVAARQQLSVEQYEQLLAERGFRLDQKQLEVVEVPLEGWLSISEFSDFIRGALPGVPLAEGASVLQEAVRQVFTELELRAVPRRWLQVVAARPQ